MKPLIMLSGCTLLINFLLIIGPSNATSVDYFSDKDFTVMMGKMIRLINGHHPKQASMQMALVGATIEKVDKSNQTTFFFEEEEEAEDDRYGDNEWYSNVWRNNDADNADGDDDGGDVIEADTAAPTVPGTTGPTAAPTAAPTGPTVAPTAGPTGTTVNPGTGPTTVPPNTGNSTNGTLWDLAASDKTVIKLKIQDKDNVTHFAFTWPGAEEPNDKRELCFFYGGDSEVHWYGGYQRYNPEWPLKPTTLTPRTPFNYLLDYQNNPAKEEFYLILEHLFINSNGFAILLDEKAPLFVRRDPAGSEPSLCISVANQYPYLENNPDPTYRDIKVQIFAAPTSRDILNYISNPASGLIAKPTAVPGDGEFTTPKFVVYSTYGQFINRGQLEDFTNHIVKAGYSGAEVVLNNQWEVNRGEFKFHAGLFGNAQDMINKLHQERFRVKVLVNPIIWDTAANQQAHRQLYLQNKAGTALTYFLDFANEEAQGFYDADLKRIHYESGVDSFYVASDALRDFHMSDYWMQMTPSLYTKAYVETVAKASANATTSLAFKTQALPLMVQLSDFQTTGFDVLLRSLIPNVLSVSMAGYSYLVPYHIGGFWPGGRPSEEIYIRMAQACALLPSMSFSWGPWTYSQKAQDIVRAMTDLHARHAPTIIALAKKRMDEGTPIIRPMWYEAPEDGRAFNISDQFMLGDDLVVAPVVEVGLRQRKVFLPGGEWTDAHGRVYKGPTETRVAANLEDLPFFTRKV